MDLPKGLVSIHRPKHFGRKEGVSVRSPHKAPWKEDMPPLPAFDKHNMPICMIRSSCSAILPLARPQYERLDVLRNVFQSQSEGAAEGVNPLLPLPPPWLCTRFCSNFRGGPQYLPLLSSHSRCFSNARKII